MLLFLFFSDSAQQAVLLQQCCLHAWPIGALATGHEKAGKRTALEKSAAKTSPTIANRLIVLVIPVARILPPSKSTRLVDMPDAMFVQRTGPVICRNCA